MPIENAVTVLGELGADGVDLYRIPVDKGRRLSLELDAVRIADRNYGDSEFDLALRVLDATGRELAHNDDNAFHIQDPVISMVAQKQGEVFVEVKHSVYSTRAIVYALHVGDNRRPAVAFPMGGMAGSEQSFQMIGDAKGTFTETIAVPEKSGQFEYIGRAPSAVPLRSSRLPNAFESNSIAKLPVALNGIIESATDVDSFQVTVKQGEAWRVRVYAASLGSPIDPRVVIQPVGKEPEIEKDDAKLGERDIFGTSYRGGGGRREVLDPSFVWRPKQTGDYLIEISDSSGAGGPTGVYRVEIEHPPTRFQSVLRSRSNDWVESMRYSGFAVPRGGRWTINVTMYDGQFEKLKGEFNIIARGLPKGVRLISPRVKPGTKLWPVQLVAERDAPLGGSVFTLEARPVETGQKFTSHSQQNVPFINHSGGNSLHYVQVDRYIAAVTDPAPFSIEVDAPSAPIVRNSEAGISVRVRRRAGFKGAVQFAVGYIGSGISSQPIEIIPANENSAILKLSVGGSAAKGKQPFVVIANDVNEPLTPWLGTGHIHVSSDIVTLEIADPYLQLSAQPTSIRRGERKTFVWKVRQLTPFKGKATARLLGLPKGLRVIEPLPILTSTSKEVTFNLEANHEALLGRVTGLNCEVVVNSNGSEIVQRAGRGNLRVDPAALSKVQR
ncbi:MAG: serine protease [Verrucomicrobiales bacterium]|nr:serine protease [Verrucomicrobiales bacterium]